MRHPSHSALLLLATLAAGCDREGVGPTESVPSTASIAWSHAGAGTPQAARNFGAPLSPGEEVPLPSLSATKNPTGNAVLRLDGTGSELSYKLIVANIENVTQAHIHCGAPGVAGPVVAFLFGFVPEGVTTDGILAEATVTAADVIPRPDSQACPGGVADLDELLAKMRSGDAYVNVHTIQNPPGEIRGRIRTSGPNH